MIKWETPDVAFTARAEVLSTAATDLPCGAEDAGPSKEMQGLEKATHKHKHWTSPDVKDCKTFGREEIIIPSEICAVKDTWLRHIHI